MSNPTTMNNPDPNEQLASALGDENRKNFSLNPNKDPLYHVLDSVRNHMSAADDAIPVVGQDEIWATLREKISSESQGVEKQSGRLYAFNQIMWLRWAAAAAILLSLTVVLWFAVFTPAPELIANSEQRLEVITLEDGSTVTLRPYSSISYLKKTDQTTLISLKGEALFEVTANRQRTFTVQTDAGRVLVTGTQFNVRSYSNESSVYVLEGSVLFDGTAKSSPVQLLPGQASTILTDGSPAVPFEFDQAEILGWTQSRLSLNNRTLISVLHEYQRQFDIQITAPDSLHNEILGGSVILETADRALQDLGAVLGGRFTQTGSATYQFEPDF
jgi:transmembrane sensor